MAATDMGLSLIASLALPSQQPLGRRVGRKPFHPRSHLEGGSEASAGLGLPTRARAKTKALGLGICKSQMPGRECPLPLAWRALPSQGGAVTLPARCSLPRGSRAMSFPRPVSWASLLG